MGHLLLFQWQHFIWHGGLSHLTFGDTALEILLPLVTLNMKEIFAVMNTTWAVNPESWDPVQAWIIFFRPYFHYCARSVHYCEDLFHIHTFIRSSNIWLSYIHSHLLVTLLFYSQTPSTKLFPCLTQLIIIVRTSQLFEVTEVHT